MSTRVALLTAFFGLAFAGACAKTKDPAPTCPRGENCRAGTGELRAHDLRGGPHGMHGAGGMGGGRNACVIGTGPLTDDVQKAVARALADERRAEAEYDQISARVPDMPIARIAHSEMRHARELERLLLAHGQAVPRGPSDEPRVDAADAHEACAIGVASEERNIAIYDELLSTSLPDDVRCVFERLRSASATRHLPAFQRCAAR